MNGSAYYLYWLTQNLQFVRKKAGFHGQVTQKSSTCPEKGRVLRTNRATRIKSRMQNERICLLLILVDPESTVCP